MVWQANRITGEFTSGSRQHPTGAAASTLKLVQRRMLRWWTGRIMAAVEHDVTIAETMFRVRNFTAPPTRLQDPRFHARVAAATLRRRYTDHSTSRRR